MPTSHITCVLAGALVCAARTAIAIVSELKIRTAVLKAPSQTFRCELASWKPIGFGPPVEQVGHEQAAEEHDFGDQEHPHAERRRLGLLRHVIEVVLQFRVMRVRVPVVRIARRLDRDPPGHATGCRRLRVAIRQRQPPCSVRTGACRASRSASPRSSQSVAATRSPIRAPSRPTDWPAHPRL